MSCGGSSSTAPGLSTLLVGAAVGLGLFGCLAPPVGRDAVRTTTPADLARRMSDAGAEPVRAESLDGSVPLERDPFDLDTPPPEVLEKIAEAAEEDDEDFPVRLNPYIRFGERILVREFDEGPTIITKLYAMPAGRAQKVIDLMGALEPFAHRPRPEPAADGSEAPFDPNLLEYQLLADWDQEYYTQFGTPTPAKSNPVTISDVLVASATYERLEEFEDFLNLFAAAGVPQVELEAKIIEIVETDSLDIGINGGFQFGSSNFVKALDFDLPNLTATEALLTLGAVQDGVTFDAILEAIDTYDNVQIDSRPRTVVRAGGVASIDSTTEIPFFEIKTITPNITTTTVYKKVGVQLFMSPRLVGTKTLALEVHLIGSQQVGSLAAANLGSAGTVEAPIIAYRTAKTVVYLEPGQTLVIGGLTQIRDRDTINKVPLLGDIPLLGYLFRSTFQSKEKQTVLFAISPRILQRSDFDTEF